MTSSPLFQLNECSFFVFTRVSSSSSASFFLPVALLMNVASPVRRNLTSQLIIIFRAFAFLEQLVSVVYLLSNTVIGSRSVFIYILFFFQAVPNKLLRVPFSYIIWLGD